MVLVLTTKVASVGCTLSLVVLSVMVIGALFALLIGASPKVAFALPFVIHAPATVRLRLLTPVFAIFYPIITSALQVALPCPHVSLLPLAFIAIPSASTLVFPFAVLADACGAHPGFGQQG